MASNQMKSIRLNVPLKFDHFEVPKGTVLTFEYVPLGNPQELTQQAVQRGIATMAEPERAVIEPQETRMRTKRR